MPAKVFFSYSHKDETLRDHLEVHLAMLKHQGLIEPWHDRRLLAGDVFDEEINNQLNAADIILLLLSPDFLASDYCYKIEQTRALERHQRDEARVISVILRPCDWGATILSRYLVTPKDGRPITSWPSLDEAFLDVTQSIRRAIASLGLAAANIETMELPVGSNARSPARSSNLRTVRNFTAADRTKFLDEALKFIKEYFEASVAELKTRVPEIKGDVKPLLDSRLDPSWLGGFEVNISWMHEHFSWFIVAMNNHFLMIMTRSGYRDGYYHKMLAVNQDDRDLFLSEDETSSMLTLEGSAELFWSIFISPLQQRDRK